MVEQFLTWVLRLSSLSPAEWCFRHLPQADTRAEVRKYTPSNPVDR